MAANMLKTRKHTVSQLQLKSDQTLHQSADSLLEGDFTISSFRQPNINNPASMSNTSCTR